MTRQSGAAGHFSACHFTVEGHTSVVSNSTTPEHCGTSLDQSSSINRCEEDAGFWVQSCKRGVVSAVPTTVLGKAGKAKIRAVLGLCSSEVQSPELQSPELQTAIQICEMCQAFKA